MRRRIHWAAVWSFVLFAGAIAVVDRVLGQYDPRDVGRALTTLPVERIAAATMLTILGYLALVACDAVGLRFLGKQIPLRRVLIPAFTSYAIGNSAPASVVAAGGVRYRLYGPLGLSAGDTAAIAGVGVVTYVLGLLAVAGVAFIASPVRLPVAWHFPALRPIGVACLSVVAAYLVAAAWRPTLFRIRGRTVRVPPLRLAGAQVTFSAMDWVLSAAALYVLLAAREGLPFLSFLGGFVVAQVITLVVPVPGGLGVFEALILLLRPVEASAPVTLAALVAYRVVYYVIPLLAAAVVLAFAEGRGERRGGTLFQTMAPVAPYVLGALTFVAGAVLLVTGALPTGGERLGWLADVLPGPVIETSQFLASVTGGLLLVLAWGLWRRSDAAYHLTRVLLVAGIVLTLLRGLDVGAAAAIAFVLGIMLPARREFTRPSVLTQEPLSADWLAGAGALGVGLAWIAVFLQRHGTLAAEPWWRIAFEGDASRAVRATVGLIVALVLFGLVRLLRPAALSGSERDR